MRKNIRKRNKKRSNVSKIKNSVADLKHTRTATVVLFTVIIFVIVMFFSVIFAVINVSNTKLVQGIYINNIDVSNKSKDEVKKSFEEILNQKKYDGIKVIHNNQEYTLEFGLLKIQNNLARVLEDANKIGRSGNIIKDNYDIIKTFLFKKKYNLELQYSKDNLETELNWIYNELPDKYGDMDYYVEDDSLILRKATTGVVINGASMAKKIEDYLNDYTTKSTSLNLDCDIKYSQEVNIQDIYNDIYVEPKDAYYTEEPFKIIPEVIGVDFAISTEEIANILNEEKQDNEYVIPLKITVPEVTIANLSIDAFPNVLSKSEGVYDVTNYNRANNLTIAGEKLNEIVIAPGEIFSYNKTLGARTIEAGYKEAAIYVSGKVVNGLGGGICQISTILYNAVLQANLEIVERKPHQFLPSYAKPGLDATVAYGSIDFKFKNNRNYPIKIKTNIVAGVAEIEILGIKEESDVSVVLKNKVIETTPYETKYVKNRTLDPDTTRVIQAGTDGKVVETYKITYRGFEEISNELISTDRYDVLNEVVERN